MHGNDDDNDETKTILKTGNRVVSAYGDVPTNVNHFLRNGTAGGNGGGDRGFNRVSTVH